MKVLGVKVTDELYEKFSSLDGTISDNLKDAIHSYMLNRLTGKDSGGLTNHEFENYDEIIRIVDEFPNYRCED